MKTEDEILHLVMGPVLSYHFLDGAFQFIHQDSIEAQVISVVGVVLGASFAAATGSLLADSLEKRGVIAPR